MSEALKGHTLADVLAAQRTISATLTDKSGNSWHFDLSPLCARIVDVMDRLYPNPVPTIQRDASGKVLLDAAGHPVTEQDDAWVRRFLAAQAGRNKAAVAAAIGAEWFGPERQSLEQQITALEDLFDYAELGRAARIVKGDAIVTDVETAEAAQDVAPFASTGETETTETP